ncbi:hypothetical protein MUK42_00625 [Musa troglodytarum]|uniref:Uncharacterized protein n=1 Tax=Musa troglodytarum TaxID=320322 RepID=A0A9E7JSI3_9LILI|nr:hypothetical protein MUK42_00625 [Musa troglodytarum]
MYPEAVAAFQLVNGPIGVVALDQVLALVLCFLHDILVDFVGSIQHLYILLSCSFIKPVHLQSDPMNHSSDSVPRDSLLIHPA